MTFVDVFNNLYSNWSYDQRPEYFIKRLGRGFVKDNGDFDWETLRKIAVACDAGHVNNLGIRFVHLRPAAIELAVDLLCPGELYF